MLEKRYINTVNKIEEEITSCRLCGSAKLEKALDFGNVALTGVFAKSDDVVPGASLVLIRCAACGLVQLGHKYDQELLYGDSYGYESHLNKSMVNHLHQKARILENQFLRKVPNPVIVDIASNDGTFLEGFTNNEATKVGIDPLIEIVNNHYPEEAIKITDFFNYSAYTQKVAKKANLVTSLSVIYDLDDPIKFARDVYNILDENGVWHLEQSYLPLMFETNSYDTICHEHLLYLSLSNIKFIVESAGLHLIDVSLNGVNGGSIAVTAMKSSSIQIPSPYVNYLLDFEKRTGIIDGKRLEKFVVDSRIHSKELKLLIEDYKSQGYDVIAFGASTKGNVLLQVAGLNSTHIRAIGEVNPRKFWKKTPGSEIPIVPESDLLESVTDKTIALILPWHFRDNLVAKFEHYMSLGGKLLFPLPRIEVVHN